MGSVGEIMKLLEMMVEATTGGNHGNSTADLRDTTKNSLSERTNIVLQLLKECSFECGTDRDTGADNSDCCTQYLHLIFWLLSKLNEVIADQTREFLQQTASNQSHSRKNEHTVPPLSPDVLSVGHQAILCKVYQFVVTLGIVPHLTVGVGVPITARSKFGHVVSSLVTSNQHNLVSNITQLLELIRPTNVRSIFMAKHLGDLLSALALLAHSHRKQTEESSIQVGQSEETLVPVGQSEESSVSVNQSERQADFKKELDDLVSKSYPPPMVRELLILQSAGGNKTPLWLRAVSGHYLTKILVSSHGVKSIIGGMISAETDDWQKFKMVGGVIATPPKNWKADRYYSLIAPQVLSLLKDPDQLVSRQYGRVCATILSSIYSKHPHIMQTLFWNPLTSDLKSVCVKRQEACLMTLVKIICSAAEPQSLLLTHCLQILPDVFDIYLQHKDTVVVTNSRLCCEQLLSACLQYSDSQSVSKFIDAITFCNSNLDAENLTLEETRSAAILFCVSKVKDSNIVEKFFIKLLEKLSSILSRPTAHPFAASHDHLIGGGDDIQELSHLLFKYRLMSLLASLCETESKVCLKHTKYVINFVQSALTHFLCGAEHVTSLTTDTETLSLSLGLLTALMSGAADVKLSEEDVVLLNRLSEPLNRLSLLACVPSETRELALNIRVAIATQRLVWLDKQPKSAASTTMPLQPVPPLSKPATLVSEIHQTDNHTDAVASVPIPENQKVMGDTSQLSRTCSMSEQVPSTGHDSDKQEVASGDTCQDTRPVADYYKALIELSDHLIAVKGHALIQLTKLIQRKDKTTLDNRLELLDLLIQHLAHSDTYIYLPAISGIVALADHFPVIVLPAVCKQYRNSQIASETRLKIGEVITKVTRLLGDLAPAYADVILPTVLIGCQSADEMLRGSSLVNLGELCKLLQYSLGIHVQEIVECLSASLITSCQSSRKGSAYSISLILTEMGSRAFDILGAEGVKKLYRSLKICISSDNDDVTIHHCAIAIASLDNVVKKSLNSNSGGQLEKRIYVLDAPPGHN